MSLISQLPLAAIRISCKNVETSKRFYKETLGLNLLDYDEDETNSKSVHFDLGNIRLTLSPSPAVKGETKAAAGGQLVFVVESSIETVYSDLLKRGIKFRSKKISEDSNGKSISFADPDGNTIYLWQPPRRDTKNFKNVEAVVRHYEFVSRALADLREYES